jgi:5-methylthioadenosine/S-adenosylhomocysteine deaminase
MRFSMHFRFVLHGQEFGIVFTVSSRTHSSRRVWTGATLIDTIIVGGHVLTLAGDSAGFIEDGAVAIEGRKIVAVGQRAEIEAVDTPRHVIDATDKLIMPGLIDAHMHSAATAGRGWAQEVKTWMASAYGPLMRHLKDEDAPLWSTLALLEGIANGTTTFGDYEFPMDQIAGSHAKLGARAVLCEGVTELNWNNRDQWIAAGWKPGDPVPLDRALGESTLARELDLYDKWHGYDEGRISVVFGPHAADFLSTEMLSRVQEEARRRKALLHLHVSQDHRENRATMRRAGLRAIPYLDSIGLLAPDLIAVHLSTATEDEVKLVASRGARMVCCSNSIGIIDGVVPPAALFNQLGGVVALGSDQSAGNNSHNMFSEMRSTAMFAKIKAEDPTVLPAHEVLRMATIGGATALGIADRTGTLEPGKDADLIVVDLARPPMAPVLLRPARNLVANLVYAETGSNVVMTMVAGKVIYENGEFANVDRDEISRQVKQASAAFQDLVAADPQTADIPIVKLTDQGLI